MIDVITFETAHLAGDALPAALRLRHKIFVDWQKYDVPCFNGMEYDQFDTPAAVYFLWRDDKGRPGAVARLIPTKFPYMIRDLWSDMVSDGELPSRSDVWEVTRLGIDPDLSTEQRKQAFGEIVVALGEFSRIAGVSSYIFVTHPRILKSVVTGTGCDVTPLGPAKKLGNFTVIAGKVTLNPDSLARAKCYHGIRGSVLRIAGEQQALAA